MKYEMICRMMSLILVIGLLFSMVACSNTPTPTEAPTETPTEAPTDAPVVDPLSSMTVENPVTDFFLSLGKTDDCYKAIMVYNNDDGTIHVVYEGDVKKVADLDAARWHNITAALNATGLAALNGQDAYNAGDASAAMNIEFADSSVLSVGYSGTIPQEFIDGYNTMDVFFQHMMADVPVYVPRIMPTNEIDPDALAAMEEIMNGTGFENLESFWVADVAKDEYFGLNMGLSSHEGIANGTQCMHISHHIPFSICMVMLEEGADAEAVIADFAENADWDKLVCVYMDNAMVAQKGNRVLCLMGSDEWYTKTADAIRAAGWTVAEELERPEE